MSGSLSYLASFGGLSSDGGLSLLNALYGIGGSSAGSSGQTAVQALASAERTQTQQVKSTAAQPEVLHAITAFTKGVNSAKSVAQLLANPAVMKVLLTANGLGDQAVYTALATKVLTSNLNDPKSLANTLTDPRWKTLAKTYNFAADGLSGIQNPKNIATVANGYAQVTWQNNQDAVTPGLTNALKFKAAASTITSVDQILGDLTIRTVVTGALGIPPQIAFQSMDAQEKAISSRLDITKFKDPKYVETFVQRYLVANSSDASSSSSTPDLTTLAIQGQGLFV
ncbi:MAG TPA: DUF1217 domain-containing protein [Rhodopila sp.]|jgi:hypothetical protein